MSSIKGKPARRAGGGQVVTVSASYGAGGSVVAPRLAERVGLPFADRLIPATAAAPPGVGGERLSEEERQESARGSFLARLGHLTGGLGLPVPTAEDLGRRVQDQVEATIRQLARTTGAVILGRAAAIVLAQDLSVSHVRLDGPEDRRVARAAQLGQINHAAARRQMTETDQARARYLKRLYGADPADPRLYHLILDSTVLALDDCVELVASAATAFWRASNKAPPTRRGTDPLGLTSDPGQRTQDRSSHSSVAAAPVSPLGAGRPEAIRLTRTGDFCFVADIGRSMVRGRVLATSTQAWVCVARLAVRGGRR